LITVTAAEPGNIEALAVLLEEMDRFYGAIELEPFDRRIRQINEALFTNPPASYAVLAWEGAQLVGFASYSYLWPAVDLTRSLYLKELYVADAARHTGVGKRLMRNLVETALKRNCSRVEWTTDNGNAVARVFYETLGFTPSSSKLFYRLEGEDLVRALG
jgi:GNAT superfamily N-acetyltransferase